MYAAAGGASLAGRKARQHGRQPAPPGSHPTSPVHPAPTGVRAFSCQHWESRLAAPPTRAQSALEPHSTCDLAECAAGRAAWQEAAAFSVGGGGAGAGGAARRCSVLGDHPTARRDPRSKWIRNNRVRDASNGSSSESDGEADDKNDTWGVARLLYAGLGTLAVGLVVYFVGTGDKGFKTPALRLVGPSLIIAGLACCLLRITFCIFAKPCCRRRTNFKESRRLSGCAEGEEMPLAGGGSGPRAGPAQCSPARRLDASSCDVSSLSSGEEDERLRRYRNPSGQQSTSILQPSVQNTSPQSTPPIPEPAIPSAMRQSASQPTAVRVTPSALPSALPNASALPSTSLQSAVRQSTSIPSAVRQSASIPIVVRQSASIPSALHPGSQPPRRPPPRNVSFAGGPDGELVLSPAQLRS